MAVVVPPIRSPTKSFLTEYFGNQLTIGRNPRKNVKILEQVILLVDFLILNLN